MSKLRPLYDIDEEAATGTASGALTAYFIRNKKTLQFDLEDGSHEWFYEQGRELEAPSEIGVKFILDHEEIILLKVGGKAKFIE